MLLKCSVVLIFAAAAAAQGVTLSISRQPDEVFRAGYLSRMKGVALYEAIVCNSQPNGRMVSEGTILQAANAHVPVVNLRLAETSLRTARQRSPLYIAARIGEYASWAAGALIGAGVIGQGVRNALIPSLTAQVSHRLSDEFATQGVATVPGEFLDAGRDLTLAPNACQARMFLGSKSKSGSFVAVIP